MAMRSRAILDTPTEKKIHDLEGELHTLRLSRNPEFSPRQGPKSNMVPGSLMETMNHDEMVLAAHDRMKYNRQKAQVRERRGGRSQYDALNKICSHDPSLTASPILCTVEG